jgi:hypothetical protein
MTFIAKALVATALTFGTTTAANATVNLFMGDNSLTTQIHLDPAFTNTNDTTIHGLTKPGDASVLFTSTAHMDGTGGTGYAQISDTTNVDSEVFNNLNIALADGSGFTGYEFTIQYATDTVNPPGAGTTPAYLTITVDVLGEAPTVFTYDASDPVLANLLFSNSAATDFRLASTDGEIMTGIHLTSFYADGTTAAAIDQIKQNDILLAVPGGVPEPGTWAMMLFGFGAAGAAMRRNRRKMVSQLA